MLEGSRAILPVNVTDDVQVRSVEVLINGRSISTDVTNPFTLDPFLPGIVGNGGPNVTLQVRATDTGGNIGRSAPITVELVADAVPLELVGFTPSFDQEVGASTRKVTYLFNKPLDPSTVVARNFQLLDGNDVVVTPLTIELRQGGTRVEVAYEALPVDDYTANVNAPEVRDILGRALGTVPLAGVNRFTVANYDNVWIAEASGDWSNAANWETGALPGAGDDLLVSVASNEVSKLDRLFRPFADFDFGSVSVKGAGTLQVGEIDTQQIQGVPAFGSLQTQSLSNTGRTVIESRGSITINGGELFNSGRIETKANLIPLGQFANGSAGRIYLEGAEVTISGGGVIELGTADVTLGANDIRSAITAFGNGTELLSEFLERTRLTTVVNMDNTIRGGGRLEGNMYLHNLDDGVIESTFDTRLTISLQQFYFYSDQFGASAFFERSTLENDGIVRATASSTLQINGTNVLNLDGKIQADGESALVLITGGAVVTGGFLETTAANSFIWIENGKFDGGATIDTILGNDLLVTGRVSFRDVNIYGNVSVQPQADLQGGVSYGVSFAGSIYNTNEIKIFSPPSNSMDVIFEDDAILQGGGKVTVLVGSTGDEIRLTGKRAEYPSRGSTDPVPDAPPPVRIINFDNTLSLSGVLKPYHEIETFQLEDPETATSLMSTGRTRCRFSWRTSGAA